MKQEPTLKTWLIALLCTYSVFIVSMLLHSLTINPQSDTQMMTYAFQFLQALQTGTLGQFLLTVHKYPLLPSLVLAASYCCLLLFLLATGWIASIHGIEAYLLQAPVAVFFLSKLLIVVCIAIILVLLPKISRRVLPNCAPYAASILYLSSLLTMIFATAVRPHIPVTAAILLCFHFSLKLADKKTLRNECMAFGTAAIAFCTLQSGFFALLFPLWGYASVNGCIEWKRLMRPRLFLWMTGYVMAALTLGYPFLLNIPMRNSVHITFDLGNNYIEQDWKWNGHGFAMLGSGVFGSDPLLFLFAFAGIVLCIRKKYSMTVGLKMMLIFLSVYVLCFGLYTGTSPRFFLPMIPFLALIGAPMLKSKTLLGALCVSIAALHLQYAILGFRPNTFDRTHAYFLEHGTGSIVSDFPFYYLNLPPTKTSIVKPVTALERYLLTLPEDLPHARTFERSIGPSTMFVVRDALLSPPAGGNFSLCQEERSGDTNEWMFLWKEVPWGFFKLWSTKHQGPNIAIFCRDQEARNRRL